MLLFWLMLRCNKTINDVSHPYLKEGKTR